MNETMNTEGPTNGACAPAGGVDAAKEAAVESAKNETVPEETTAAGAPVEETPAPEVPATTGDAPQDAPSEPVAPTQDEVDAMVDYCITTETLAQFPPTPDGRIFKVGDVVKLSKDHPLLAKPVTNSEGGAPSA